MLLEGALDGMLETPHLANTNSIVAPAKNNSRRHRAPLYNYIYDWV